MKKTILVLILLFSIFMLAQEKEKDSMSVVTTINTDEPIPFEILNDTPPLPLSCENVIGYEKQKKCLAMSIQKHVNYKFNTGLASKTKAKGKIKIIVTFIITLDGTIDNIKVNTEYEILKNEAIRVIKEIPKMIPGTIDNVPVRVKYTLPITILAV